MPKFPFLQPQSDTILMSATCHIYYMSLLRVLPISAVIIFIYFLLPLASHYVPIKWHHIFSQSVMLLMILTLALIGWMVRIIDAIGKEQPFFYIDLFKNSCKQLLSFIGVLISMALFPAIVFMLFVGIHVLLTLFYPNFNLLFSLNIIGIVLIFAAVTRKIFAPILVFTDDMDTNTALDYSEVLTKGFFLRTFFHGFYAFLLLVFLVKVPNLIGFYFSLELKIGKEISALLLILIAPWTIALLLTDKYDLHIRTILKQKPKAPTIQSPG